MHFSSESKNHQKMLLKSFPMDGDVSKFRQSSYFRQFLCPTLGDISHHQSLNRILVLCYPIDLHCISFDGENICVLEWNMKQLTSANGQV
jgi:hypothetical protein